MNWNVFKNLWCVKRQHLQFLIIISFIHILTRAAVAAAAKTNALMPVKCWSLDILTLQCCCILIPHNSHCKHVVRLGVTQHPQILLKLLKQIERQRHWMHKWYNADNRMQWDGGLKERINSALHGKTSDCVNKEHKQMESNKRPFQSHWILFLAYLNRRIKQNAKFAIQLIASCVMRGWWNFHSIHKFRNWNFNESSANHHQYCWKYCRHESK